MNALLAASPTLTLKTYTVCTALSLFKVIIHTTIGASIHSFAGFHLHQPSDGADPQPEETCTLGRVTAGIGIALCIVIIVYLGWVARKAVDEELENDGHVIDAEEAQVLLEPSNDEDDLERGMAESPFGSRPLENVQGKGASRSLQIGNSSSSR
jgi:hypothetical protein